jgi:hypothetical protein
VLQSVAVKPAARPRIKDLAALAWLSDLQLTIALFVPGALTVALSFQSGGFFAGTTALAAVEMALVAGLVVLGARRPLDGVGPFVMIAGAALLLLAGWTLLSSHWSHSESRALLAYDRTLLYALTFAAFGVLGRTEARMRMLMYGVTAGIVVVAAVALVARTMPDVITPPISNQPDRLSYPLMYWNALGAMTGVGLVLCGHFACSLKEKWFVRVAAAAAVPLLAATLYYTFSRGATWATAIAVVVYVLAARPRGLIAGAGAMLPPTLVALMIVNPATMLTHPRRYADGIAAGHDIAVKLALCAAAAGFLRLLMLRLDKVVERIVVPRRVRSAVTWGLPAVTAAAVLTAVALGHAHVGGKVDQFHQGGVTEGAGGAGRFMSVNDDGRIEQWNLALDSYRAHRFHGTGAGTFELEWAQKRHRSATIVNVHSAYLESLTELGWPGLVLLVVGIGGLLIGVATRVRGPQRGLYAALLAAGVAWALQAGVDWLWEVPAASVWLFAAGGLALGVQRHGAATDAPQRRRWLRIPVAAGLLGLALVPAQVVAFESDFKTGRVAYKSGDCKRAAAPIAAAIADSPKRPEPHVVAAACAMRGGQPALAAAAMSNAVAVDRGSWVLWYDLAVAQAARGSDPAPAARQARLRNPLEPLTKYAVEDLSRGGPLKWRRSAKSAVFLVP